MVSKPTLQQDHHTGSIPGLCILSENGLPVCSRYSVPLQQCTTRQYMVFWTLSVSHRRVCDGPLKCPDSSSLFFVCLKKETRGYIEEAVGGHPTNACCQIMPTMKKYFKCCTEESGRDEVREEQPAGRKAVAAL